MRKIITAFLLFLASESAVSQTVRRYDVVIAEIMADPFPQAGLPNNEWVELRNVSPAEINLQGWRLGDAGSLSGPMPLFLLKPDSAVIVCSASAVSVLSAFGRAIPVSSFPSLDNDGDRLHLLSQRNLVVHAVEYNSSWYGNEVKRNGGWTLEMIDTRNPCAGINNWIASADLSGGTPGRKNSVDGVIEDTQGPELIATICPDSLTIVAMFNEPVDSLTAGEVANYSLSNGPAVAAAVPDPPLFNRVTLRLSSPVVRQVVYTLTVANIRDCKGNIIINNNAARAGIPEPASANDLIINEVLFNPRPTGYDYVELYNRSNKIIDVAKIFIATRNGAGDITGARAVVNASRLFFPEEYLVVTEHTESLKKEYMVSYPLRLVSLALPSFPNEEGAVVVMGPQEIIDELNYSDQWHFPLISNREGVALERIDPEGSSQDKSNWHSAASTAGYGTPTYQNSQYRMVNNGGNIIEASKIFSPDNDGHDDVAVIVYRVDEMGCVGGVTIFNTSGSPVRHLVKNGLLALKGSWTWDGLGDNQQELPVGNYIICSELFNLRGKRYLFRNVVVLARKLGP